jgi:hypothetical protein
MLSETQRVLDFIGGAERDRTVDLGRAHTCGTSSGSRDAMPVVETGNGRPLLRTRSNTIATISNTGISLIGSSLLGLHPCGDALVDYDARDIRRCADDP